MTKFKVGDIVMCEAYGEEGRVREVSDNGRAYRVTTFYDGETGAEGREELSLVHDSFEIGDRVSISRNFHHAKGRTGIVSKTIDSDGEYSISFGENSRQYVPYKYVKEIPTQLPTQLEREVEEAEQDLEGGNEMNENKTVNIGNALLEELKSLVVEGESSGLALTPSGLSIGGKVFSAKEGALLNVDGLELIKDIPFGFILPTEINSIEKGDILFDKDSKPLYVVSKSDKAPFKVVCVDSEEREATLYPVLNIFKGQVFNKLMTPFNYDLGCNPTLNTLTFGVASYLNGGTQGIIKDLIPQLITMSSKLDLSTILKQKGMTTIAPFALVGYKIITNKQINLKGLKIKEIATKLKIDKKLVSIAIIALLLALYLNKDKVSQYLISSKVKKIPVVGLVAKPIAKVLGLVPTINKKVWKDFLTKLTLEE